ncbi:MAG: hypothetical protein ACLSUZ_06600 [Bifidobacterium pseudocatenulatum]
MIGVRLVVRRCRFLPRCAMLVIGMLRAVPGSAGTGMGSAGPA